MPPGPGLARALADLDVSLVPNDDIDDVLQARSRQLAHEQAQMFAVVSEVICRRPFAGPLEVRGEDHPDQYGSDEVRAVLCWTRRHAESETNLAYTMTHVLPLVQAALLAGEIDRGKAWIFAHHLVDLAPEQIAAICAALLPLAARLTAGQIAERIKRMILELDPVYYARRYRKAVRERMVVAYLSADGTVVISASGLPADEAAVAWERLDAMARAARHDGHPGTLDQIRADLVLGLLDGSLEGLDRGGILQALVERFAGHADSGPGDRAGALVRTGVSGRDGGDEPGGAARPHGPGPDSPRPDGPGPSNPDPGGPGPGAEGPGPGSQGPGPRDPGSDSPGPDPNGPALDGPTLDTPASDGPPLGGSEARVDHRVGTEVRAPLSALLGLDDRAGELPGWGPIPALAARRLVARQRRAQWRWAVVDDSGRLRAEGITRRRPAHAARGGPRGGIVELQVPASLLAALAADPARCGSWAGVVADIAARFAAQGGGRADLDAHPDERFPRAALRRYVQVRDRTCVHPGCRCSAVRADLDHTRDHFFGGATTQDDLSPLCRHHHMLKTEGGWRLWQPEPGWFVWRSPLGRIYPVRPEPILPPPLPPVAPEPDPDFDEPTSDGDYRPDLTVRDRAPPPEADPDPAETDDPPPF